MSRLIVLLVLIGCPSDPIVVAPPRPVEPVVASKPIAPPIVLPLYDDSLDSLEKVADWQADTIAKVGAYAALPDPEKIRAKYEAYFKVEVTPQPFFIFVDPIAAGTLSAAGQKKLRAEFKIGNAGTSDEIRAAIVKRIQAKLDAAYEPKDDAGVALSNAMFVGINALWTNAEADRARREDGSEAPRHVIPSTQEELDAIMAPVKAELAAKGIPDFEPYVTTGP